MVSGLTKREAADVLCLDRLSLKDKLASAGKSRPAGSDSVGLNQGFKGALMKDTVTRQGRVVVEGLVFDWCQDATDRLEVWQWQCGRRFSRLTNSTPDATARALALELIAELDQRMVSRLNPSLPQTSR